MEKGCQHIIIINSLDGECEGEYRSVKVFRRGRAVSIVEGEAVQWRRNGWQTHAHRLAGQRIEREYHQSVKVFRREEQFLLWKGKLSTPQWRWVARSLGQNQRATATEILLVEMFHHSRSQSHMRMQIVSPHGTCPCPHFRRVNRANHMVPKVSIWVKTSSSFFPHGLLADVVSGKWEPTFTCCNC